MIPRLFAIWAKVKFHFQLDHEGYYSLLAYRDVRFDFENVIFKCVVLITFMSISYGVRFGRMGPNWW